MTFSEEAFLAQKPGAPLQAFHRRAVHLQLFKQVRQNRGGGAEAGGGARAGLELKILGPWGASRSYRDRSLSPIGETRVGPAGSHPSRSPGGGGMTALPFP